MKLKIISVPVLIGGSTVHILSSYGAVVSGELVAHQGNLQKLAMCAVIIVTHFTLIVLINNKEIDTNTSCSLILDGQSLQYE